MNKIKVFLVMVLVTTLLLQCSGNISVQAATNPNNPFSNGMFLKYESYHIIGHASITYYIDKTKYPTEAASLDKAIAVWEKQVSGLTFGPVTNKSLADIVLVLSDAVPFDGTSGECNKYDKYNLCVNNDPLNALSSSSNFTKAECVVFMKSPRVKGTDKNGKPLNEYIQVMAHEIGHALGLNDLDRNYTAMPYPVMVGGLDPSEPSQKRSLSLTEVDKANIKARWDMDFIPCRYYRADLNMDGAVNMSDVMLLAKGFNIIITKDEDTENAYDLNNDNVVNMKDVMLLGQFFGRSYDEMY